MAREQEQWMKDQLEEHNEKFEDDLSIDFKD